MWLESKVEYRFFFNLAKIETAHVDNTFFSVFITCRFFGDQRIKENHFPSPFANHCHDSPFSRFRRSNHFILRWFSVAILCLSFLTFDYDKFRETLERTLSSSVPREHFADRCRPIILSLWRIQEHETYKSKGERYMLKLKEIFHLSFYDTKKSVWRIGDDRIKKKENGKAMFIKSKVFMGHTDWWSCFLLLARNQFLRMTTIFRKMRRRKDNTLF